MQDVFRSLIQREIRLQHGGNPFQNPISGEFLSLHPCTTPVQNACLFPEVAHTFLVCL